MSLSKARRLIAVACVLLCSQPLAAQDATIEAPENVVFIEARVPDQSVVPGKTTALQLVVTIKEGWHINAYEPLDEFLIPTKITMQENAAIEKLSIDYPESALEKFAFSEAAMAVYSHEAVILAKFKVADDFQQETLHLEGVLHFQTCNDAVCLPPAQKSFQAAIPVKRAAGEAEPSLQIGAAQSPSFGEFGAQDESAEQALVRTEVKFSLDKVLAGGDVKAAVILDIAEGWHINSNTPLDEFLIPTEIAVDSQLGVAIGEPIYPPHELFRFSFSEEDVAVYEGKAVIVVPISVDAAFAEPALRVSGTVTYQACNDNSCLAPTSVAFAGELPRASRSEAIAPANMALFANTELDDSENALNGNEIGGLIAEKGLPLTLVLIFLGGLALNLTPCVYPLIPITVSFFGGQAKGSTARVLLLAFVYLLGMAITYSILGVAAALSGSLFGGLLQNPFVLIGIAAIMVGLALSMFGVWELTVPQALNRLAGSAKQGYAGALFMGLTVGIVAAPCIGPFVLGLLTYVGAIGDPLLGFWMFFTLSLGLGLPYVVLGTFSASLKNLPRSGMWMVWVKKIFGFVLLGMAAYFLDPILPDLVARFLLPAILLAGGLVVGFLDRTQMATKAFPFIKRAVGIALIAIAAWLAWPAESVHDDAWQVYSKEALAQAAEEGKPVIIDFTAEWCISCKELEKLTFPSEPVMQRADKFYLLRADLTKFASPPVEKIKKEFNIKGLPTVIFIDSTGVENKNLRVIGFVDGEDFARRMDELLVKMSN